MTEDGWGWGTLLAQTTARVTQHKMTHTNEHEHSSAKTKPKFTIQYQETLLAPSTSQ